jgi:hypothetical protein
MLQQPSDQVDSPSFEPFVVAEDGHIIVPPKFSKLQKYFDIIEPKYFKCIDENDLIDSCEKQDHIFMAIYVRTYLSKFLDGSIVYDPDQKSFRETRSDLSNREFPVLKKEWSNTRTNDYLTFRRCSNSQTLAPTSPVPKLKIIHNSENEQDPVPDT